MLEDFRNLVEIAKHSQQEIIIWNQSAIRDNWNAIAGPSLKVGKGSWRGVLLDDEVRINLGGFNTPSMAMVICSKIPVLIHHGRITLIGPDIPEIDIMGEQDIQEIEFAMIALVGGSNIEDTHLKKIRDVILITDDIEGFSLRALNRRYWYRISKEIVKKQVSFQHIGLAFLRLFTKTFPKLVETVEIIFIINDRSIIEKLNEFEKSINSLITEKIKEKLSNTSEKIRDDCDFDWGCEECNYKTTCDELKKMITFREDALKEKQI
jgi:CO dehydrogenase/acetyl-CoA synthase beta subunit